MVQRWKYEASEMTSFAISVKPVKPRARMVDRTSVQNRSLIGFLAITFLAASAGSVTTLRNVQTWYPALMKPTWTPPNAVFGPMWTFLYFAMAVAAWRVWRAQSGTAAAAVLRSYGAQLCLNVLWSV